MAKYCWGSNPFPLGLWAASWFVAAILVTVVYENTTPDGPAVAKVEGVNVSTVGGVILVTLGWILHYYNTIGHQVGLKFTNAFAPNPQAGTVGERSMMNTLEQGIVFLPLLWMHALFVDVSTSVSMGWLYVITRMLYPIFYTFYGHFTVLIELSTSPNYAVIAYYAFALLDACHDPTTTLVSRLTDAGNPALRGLIFFLTFPVLFLILLVIPNGGISTVLNNHANPKGGTAYHEEPDDTEEEE